MTAIIEIRPESGALLTVLEISLNDPNVTPLLMTVGIHEFTAKSNPNTAAFHQSRTRSTNYFSKVMVLRKRILLLDQYLTEVVMQVVAEDNEDAYELTAAIARIMFGQDEFFYQRPRTEPRLPAIHGFLGEHL